ncbi:hypothetical protein [Streptomyces albipurpureus]|uniref:NAD-dependent epimerase/dehydratase domain-containing protein n=1 Tax=Streptomyces albipurpureus TaxID=2897419 RepID=A0ABT0UUF9_9ACTN|nr:hypothetical protein [Streptomyces sp. CWNU-1]MCM2392100.1 hypothetical protein [Streptomyces sp. CWNU-1]
MTAPEGALRVVMDPDPTGTPSVLRTALAAWSSIEEGATHQLVIQDDMMLSENFFERVRLAIEAMPDAALALFALWDSRNGAAVRFGAMTGARWVGAVNEYFPCVAIVLPRKIADGFVDYGRTRLGAWPDDILMYRYLREHGVPRYVSVPNLAEHEDRGSISGNAFRGPRRSVCFVPSDPIGDENVRLTGLGLVPFFKNGVAQCAVRISAPGPRRWLHLECETYLEGRGVSAAQLRGAGRTSSDPDVRGTWLTGFTLGLHGPEQRAGLTPQAPGRPDPAVLAESLATIGPGGISHTSSEERIAERRDELARAAADGLEAGRETARELIRAKSRSRRRTTSAAKERPPGVEGDGPAVVAVGVVGSSTPVGEHILRGLADRRHAVTAVGPTEDHTRFDAIVDLRGLRDTEATATIRLSSAPDGTPLLRAVSYTLRAGDLYGPGCSRHTPIGRMVWNALRSQSVVIEGSPDDPLHPLYVHDLADALSVVLRTPPTETVLTLAGPASRTAAEVAQAVHRAVRPVPIEHAPASSAIGTAAKSRVLVDGVPLSGWGPKTELPRGLHGFAQWLAYEGIALMPD